MIRLRFVLTLIASFASSVVRAQDPVLDWNATLRQVIQADVTTANPGWSTRSMAMMNAAMYDVYQAGVAPAGANREAALAQVAYALSFDCYDLQGAILDAARTTALNAIPDSPEKTAGIAFGNAVAQSYMTMRSGDGSDVSFMWPENHDPGHWESDPMHPGQSAWGPKWGEVAQFVPNPNPYTYGGVPDMNTTAYFDAFEEVRTKGVLTGSTRTADEEHIALFWAYDRPTMGPPPVLFNRNLHEIAETAGNSPEDNARLFAMASVAMADAAITAWDYKFAEDFWRPVTAIRRAAEDGNNDTLADANWIPMGAPGDDSNATADDFTPPFPAWPSGHATMGGALFETLRVFYGDDAMNYTLSSQELPMGSNTRNFTTFSQAEWENAVSRIYLGIHWIFDATDGIAIGNQVADWISQNHFASIPEPSSIVLLSAALLSGGFWIRRRR
jgi:hypothetical protein